MFRAANYFNKEIYPTSDDESSTDQVYRLVDVGVFPTIYLERAKELLYHDPPAPLTALDTQHRALGGLARLASHCSLDIVPGAAEYLQYQQSKRVRGCKDRTGSKKS
jgi:hypothetical protein